ncbi:MAG: hypothetical protein RL756_2071 [Pseudomonadota bacterium]|jgi:hypothetical protein
MAIEFPQPQMPVEDEEMLEGEEMMEGEEEEDDGTFVDIEEEFAEVEEQPDGSAIVRMEEFKGPNEDEDFYQNLADTMPEYEMQKLALRYLELIEKDKQARKERDKQYEEGIRRTGLGNDAPGGADFQGASKVVHPVMAEACVDFEARAIKELFPPDGPVRTHVVGEATEEQTKRAERKRDFMNWQLTEQIPNFRDEQEVLLTQLPLGGSQYMKMWWDARLRRPDVEFIPIDNMLLPFASNNFYTAQRATEIHDITQQTFQDRISQGLYRDVSFVRATMEPETSEAQKATNKIEGKTPNENEDGVRRVYHIYCYMELEDDKFSEGQYAPYILMIDEMDTEVLGLYRNWEQGDPTMTKLDWVIEWKFIPWRGAYAIGLPHLIGGLSAALTGSLRALLDTAHINNSATMLKLKGAKISGQSQSVDVTQVTEIEGAPGVDDIRKIAMPMPFNPPSETLFKLLGWLTSAAKGVVTTSEEKIADIKSTAPVGTTQALIEQGAAVFSAIHARLHESQRKTLMILQRINRWYIEDMLNPEVPTNLEIRREDFNRSTDVIPVSDPHIFSETQRMAQNQAVMAYMKEYPQLFDQRAVVYRALKQMKIPNITELMPAVAEPMEINAAEENAAMSIGRAAYAYPHQNQLAHIQAHLDYALNPMLGSNPIIAPTYLPMALEHLKQHLMLWYMNHMNGYVEESLGGKVKDYHIAGITGDVDKLFALASQHTMLDVQESFAKVMPAIQQIQKVMQQFAPKPPMDGGDRVILETSMAETKRRAEKDKADLALEKERMTQEALRANREQQIKIALNAADNLTDERIKTAEITRDTVALQQEQQQAALTALQGATENLRSAENGNV